MDWKLDQAILWTVFSTDAAAAREGRTCKAEEGVVCITPGTTAV